MTRTCRVAVAHDKPGDTYMTALVDIPYDTPEDRVEAVAEQAATETYGTGKPYANDHALKFVRFLSADPAPERRSVKVEFDLEIDLNTVEMNDVTVEVFGDEDVRDASDILVNEMPRWLEDKVVDVLIETLRVDGAAVIAGTRLVRVHGPVAA